MLPGLTLPASLRRLLDAFAGCFTKPTLVVFTAMVVGMIAQAGSKTVCGMLAGAGLAQTWSHDRVHRFFARAVWSIDAMGMVVQTQATPAATGITYQWRRGDADTWTTIPAAD